MLIPRYLALILNPAQSLAAGFTLLCIKKKKRKEKSSLYTISCTHLYLLTSFL